LLGPLMVVATPGRGPMSAIETAVKTPCNCICALHPVSGLCMGCGRSVEEIAGWLGFDDNERAAIMARLMAIPGASIVPRMA
jgi:predicted Fe-S protein YdhL (DUF1289 family)